MPLPSAPATDRREFLIESARLTTAGWLAFQLPLLASLQACARQDFAQNAPFKTLTPAEGAAMRAFAAQILPAEHDLPGAEEAGAVFFIDRAVSVPPYAEKLPELRTGLAALDVRAKTFRAAKGFASLDSTQQIALMREVEASPFFKTARMLTLMGTFSEPTYGGNRDGIGWHLAGMEHADTFQAPFGWYDDPAHRGLIA
jgi:gluconate 2-dehydrogenase gamma chain